MPGHAGVWGPFWTEWWSFGPFYPKKHWWPPENRRREDEWLAKKTAREAEERAKKERAHILSMIKELNCASDCEYPACEGKNCFRTGVGVWCDCDKCPEGRATHGPPWFNIGRGG